MSKKNRKLLALTLSMCMIFSMSLTSFARTYSLDLPYPLIGSMQSTAVYTKSSSSTPYVQPSKNTISTNYFLSTTEQSSITATDIIATTTTTKKTFTWKTGYGGVGTSYCLSAYPNVSGSYDAYNVAGTWSE